MLFQRHISVIGLLFTSLSAMIGSGWLFAAFLGAQLAGPAVIISWILGGALIITIALVFSELSTSLALAGGVARYLHFTHGTCASFCISWLAWLSCVAVAPTEIQAILQYNSEYFPWLTHQIDHTTLLTTKGYGVAVVLLLVLSLLNTLGIRLLTRINSIFTVWKLGVPILTAVVLLSQHFSIDNLHTAAGFAPYGVSGILSALSSVVVFSYLGFREATSLAQEAKNPQIAIPLAVMGSVLIGMVVYLALQIALLGAIDTHMLSLGWTGLHFSGDSGPFAGIATILGMTWLSTLIHVDASITPASTGLIYTTTTARLNYAMSVNHYTPQFMLKLNQKGVPARAVMVNFFIGLLLFLPLPTWQDLIQYQSLAMILAYASGPIALCGLRQQAPALERPFRIPAYPAFSTLTFIICNLIAYWTGWHTLWRLMISIIIGLCLLTAYRHHYHRDHSINLRHAYWMLPYYLGLSLISYLGQFGGMGLLSYGWDMVMIIILSVIIMQLANRAQQDRETVEQCIRIQMSHA